MASYRGQKINNEMKRELSSILREIKDPRVPQLISVVKVEVTKDLKFAKVYISMLGTDGEKQNALKGLKSAHGFVRTEVSRRLGLRATPEFTFLIDDSIEYGSHITDIINKINNKEV